MIMKNSGFFARLATIAAFVVGVAAPLVVAAPANADNASFLGRMNEIGLSSELGDSGLLQVGKAACGMLRPDYGLMFGRHPNLVADIVWQKNPMLERNEAGLLVNAAIDNLCPGVNALGYASV